ncbi:MAG: hypothetical protein NXI09_15920, partial [Bacteroidetes bacterium]|nr:hypothetical protein [Bacteroidota bacterium]
MQSSYDDSEPRNVLNNSAHYYAYDHTGNRILKANMFFGNVGVNSNQTLSVPMEAPTVYVNPYYITSHFEEVVLSSKHYYMGSQRIASNMISADFDHEAPLLEPIQAPEGRYGYTNAEAAIVDDILSTLRCLTGDEELAFDLGDFLYLPSIGEGITFTDDEG